MEGSLRRRDPTRHRTLLCCTSFDREPVHLLRAAWHNQRPLSRLQGKNSCKRVITPRKGGLAGPFGQWLLTKPEPPDPSGTSGRGRFAGARQLVAGGQRARGVLLRG